MFCTNCGKQIPDDARFCPECGAQMDPQVNTANTVSTTNQTHKKNNNFNSSSKEREQINYVAILGSLINFLSIFFTFLSANENRLSAQSVTLMTESNEWGYIVLFSSIIVIVLVLFKIDLLSFLASAFAGGYGVYIVYNTNSILSKMISYSDSYSNINKGTGYYLLLIGSIVLIISAVYEVYKMVSIKNTRI